MHFVVHQKQINIENQLYSNENFLKRRQDYYLLQHRFFKPLPAPWSEPLSTPHLLLLPIFLSNSFSCFPTTHFITTLCCPIACDLFGTSAAFVYSSVMEVITGGSVMPLRYPELTDTLNMPQGRPWIPKIFLICLAPSPLLLHRHLLCSHFWFHLGLHTSDSNHKSSPWFLIRLESVCRHRRTKEETVTLMILPPFLLLPSCPQLPLKHPDVRLLHTTQVLRGSHSAISPVPGERLGQGQAEPGACGDALRLTVQAGVSCWKACPWRFGSCSCCLHFLCPDSDGDKGSNVPLASLLADYPRVLTRHLWPAAQVPWG